MDTKVLFLFLVLCVVIAKTKDCHGNSGDRFKRSKYFPYPPPGAAKYYRKPPMVFHPGFPGYGSPGKSIVSYTPPPNYMDEQNSYPPHITNSRPYVSKRPSNDGLGDADINNIVKFLSKQDLDKIIEYAGEKDNRPNELERDIEVEFNGPVGGTKYYSTKPTYGNNEQTDERFSLNGPYINGDTNKNYSPNSNYHQFANTPLESMVKYKTVPYLNDPYSQDSNIAPSNQREYLGARERPRQIEQTKATNLPFNNQESIQSYNTPTYLGPLQASNIRPNDRDLVETEDEPLPKPLNLRDDTQDIEAEYSRNVEVVASPTYKVESFGDLPVMDYHSKRFSVSSYNVPHYSITSHSRAPPAPAVEPAPDASAARANSDAHLKAVRIWTHKSNGAAYTLHNDGSLSVERPLRTYRSP